MSLCLTRSKFIHLVNNFDDLERKKKTAKIFTRLQKINDFRMARIVGFFLGVGHEISTFDFIKKLLKKKKGVCLPKIVGGQLEFRKIKNLEMDLVVGPYGILEPNEECPLVRPHNINLLCVPAVMIDLYGNRVGRGKGYYDRYLERSCIKKTVSLVYEEQIVLDAKPKKHDQPVDIVITEKRILRFSHTQLKKLLNGIKIADQVMMTIKKKIQTLSFIPKLTVILVGNNPASKAYVFKKKQTCEENGIFCDVIQMPIESSQQSVVEKIIQLNNDVLIHGILVQLPLPESIDAKSVIDAIDQKKDVDGLTDNNHRLLLAKKEAFQCCTSAAVLFLLKFCSAHLKDKKVVLVGYGNLVGKPLYPLLLREQCKVTICTKTTKNLVSKTKQSDIVISATGVAHLISKKHLKQGAIVIDVGFARKNGYCVGDVDFDAVFSKVSFITPSPGGVGPLTIAMLLKNVVLAAERSEKA